MRTGGSGRAQHTFETYTDDLVRLRTWLTRCKVTHAAMESTGAYWKPVWNILEPGKFEKLLVNPQHFHGLPGQKIDPNDSRWLAELLSYRLLRASFVPPQPILGVSGKKIIEGLLEGRYGVFGRARVQPYAEEDPGFETRLKGRVSNITGGCSNNYPAIWTRWIPGLCQSSNRSSSRSSHSRIGSSGSARFPE